MKSITLVARDVGGSQPLGMLTEFLLNRHWQVNSFLGNGKPIDDLQFLTNVVRKSKVLLYGMSSSPVLAEPEIKAIKLAREAGIPYAIFADAFDSHTRTWLQEEIAGTAAFFVLNEDEAKKARSRFPGLNVIASGNPVWETFAFPEKTYKGVRSTFGVESSAKMIVVVGTKEPTINIALLSGVLEAASKFGAVRVFFSLHPGDQTPVAFYEPLVAWSGGQIQLVPTDVMSGSDLIVGADLIVDSFSTIAIQAGFLRQRVVTYVTALALSRLELITGARDWEPIKRGWTIPVYGNNLDLFELLKLFCERTIEVSGPFTKLHAKQEESFTAPQQLEQSLKSIANALEALVDEH